jgi:phospholipase C
MTSRIAIALAALALCGVTAGGAGAASSGVHAPRTPIKHFIVLMQENHSYDNYFGTYPRGDGLPANVCMPKNLARRGAGCVRPYELRNKPVQDLGHNAAVFDAQFNGGRMNGFVSAFNTQGLNGELTMGHYDGNDIPFYWNIADEFVLFDRFFTSAAGGSVWNHMFWVSGTPGNPKTDEIPNGGFGNLPMIFDRLEQAGVSWKFYVQNYDPRITFRARVASDRGSQIVWVPPLDYSRYLDNPKLMSHIADMEQYYRDLNRGTLPEVVYMAPSGSSEHPPGSIQAGERFVRTIMNALIASKYWDSSAFTWTYDDWGGWYDHVKPPKVDKWGYGFRAPALLVSPYARRGYIDHTTLDFTSYLKFIEQNWNLRPLGPRDAKANSIIGAFDFSQTPRSPAIIPALRGVKPPATPKRSIVYPSYVLAFLLTAALILGAAYHSRRGRGPDLPAPPGPPTGGGRRREAPVPAPVEPQPSGGAHGSLSLPRLPERRSR